MKKLILLSILSFNAFFSLHSNDNILMITFPDKAAILAKINPISSYVIQKINILPSIEKRTFSHIELKEKVEKALNDYNRTREISDISDSLIEPVTLYLMETGTRTYVSSKI